MGPDKLEHWRQDYNRVRPHSALDDSTPEEFASAWQTAAASTSSDGLQVGLSRLVVADDEAPPPV
jgi:hypothetical protein